MPPSELPEVRIAKLEIQVVKLETEIIRAETKAIEDSRELIRLIKSLTDAFVLHRDGAARRATVEPTSKTIDPTSKKAAGVMYG